VIYNVGPTSITGEDLIEIGKIMNRKFQRREFGDFWRAFEDKAYLDPHLAMPFADGFGFHVYAELKLNLDLIAAENSRDAFKCVELLEDFTAISNRCADLAGVRILEVQGDRIHFFFQATEVGFDNVAHLLAFSSALTRTAYSQLKPAAGGDWRGFSMAADWGVSVFVPSNFGGGSLISLGDAANQPAKKLGAGVSSGHLALPLQIGKKIPGGKRIGNWIEVNVETSTAETQSFFNEGLTEQMMRAAKEVLNKRQQPSVSRTFATDWNSSLPISSAPLRTRGMCLRADLDGFTKLVREAFDHGASAVAELVQQFTKILEFPKAFANDLGRPIIELPWAGDCCTLLIRPAFQETLEEMRSVLPPEAGRKWHSLARQNSNQNNWPELLKGSKWALGFACGTKDEGGDGNAVITEFPASNRTFRVMVSWSSRRAKDAQEADGVKAEFVVVPEIDYRNLEELFKPSFSQLNSLYRATTYEKLVDAREITKEHLAKSSPTKVAGVTAAIPAQRPFMPLL
jgi:hypothetical protein